MNKDLWPQTDVLRSNHGSPPYSSTIDSITQDIDGKGD